MKLYTVVGSGIGSADAAALSARLAAWHDAMVVHERRIRGGRTEELCDEECPHAEAPVLWNEALETFGGRAHDLTFLRTRAMTGSSLASKSVVSTDVASTADRANGSRGTPNERGSNPFVRSPERRLPATLEL